MLLIHVPLNVLAIVTLLKEGNDCISDHVEIQALNTALELIDLIPERAFQIRPPTSQSAAASVENDASLPSNAEVLKRIKGFYVEDQGYWKLASLYLSTREICEVLIRESGSIFCQSLLHSVSSADAGNKSKLLGNLLAKVPKVESLDISKLLSAMHTKLASRSQLPFLVFTSIVSVATALHSTSHISATDISRLVDPLVRLAWSYLSPSRFKYHVESVRCLWQLQTTLSTSNHEIEASICGLIKEHDRTDSSAGEIGSTFGTLWLHTLQDSNGRLDRRSSKSSGHEVNGVPRLSGADHFEVMLGKPLYLLLDALQDDQTNLFITMRTWLQNSVCVDK